MRIGTAAIAVLFFFEPELKNIQKFQTNAEINIKILRIVEKQKENRRFSGMVTNNSKSLSIDFWNYYIKMKILNIENLSWTFRGGIDE
jgi:hypothetical protein